MEFSGIWKVIKSILSKTCHEKCSISSPFCLEGKRRLLSGLDKDARNQVTDYIITRYSVIRYDLLEACYGSYENMITAINSNAGCEYDINESMYTKGCHIPFK